MGSASSVTLKRTNPRPMSTPTSRPKNSLISKQSRTHSLENIKLDKPQAADESREKADISTDVKRDRSGESQTSPAAPDVTCERTVQAQECYITSLTNELKAVKESLAALKSIHKRSTKKLNIELRTVKQEASLAHIESMGEIDNLTTENLKLKEKLTEMAEIQTKHDTSKSTTALVLALSQQVSEQDELIRHLQDQLQSLTMDSHSVQANNDSCNFSEFLGQSSVCDVDVDSSKEMYQHPHNFLGNTQKKNRRNRFQVNGKNYFDEQNNTSRTNSSTSEVRNGSGNIYKDSRVYKVCKSNDDNNDILKCGPALENKHRWLVSDGQPQTGKSDFLDETYVEGNYVLENSHILSEKSGGILTNCDNVYDCQVSDCVDREADVNDTLEQIKNESLVSLNSSFYETQSFNNDHVDTFNGTEDAADSVWSNGAKRPFFDTNNININHCDSRRKDKRGGVPQGASVPKPFFTKMDILSDISETDELYELPRHVTGIT